MLKSLPRFNAQLLFLLVLVLGPLSSRTPPGSEPRPSVRWAYLQLLAGPVGSAQNLVVVHHAVLAPQQRDGRVRGVDGQQQAGRGRLCGTNTP